ncbi:MAG: M24 family metallopeptidase [Bacillota bacterium]
MIYTPKEELQQRLKNLQENMARTKLDGVLLQSNMMLYYFTGTAQSGMCYVPVTGDPLLLIFKSLDRAIRESALESIAPIKSLKELGVRLAEYGCPLPLQIGLELDVLPAKDFRRLEELLPGVRLADASTMLRKIRARKSPYELDLLRQAAALHDRMFRQVEKVLHPGMKEIELAAELEFFSRKQGHLGYVNFRGLNCEIHYGHLMAGPGSACPSCLDSPTGGRGLSPAFPQGPGFSPIKAGEPVMVDYLGRYLGYLVDQTRIFCLGKLPDKLTRAHAIALEIQTELASLAKPGVSCAWLYDQAIKLAKGAGLDGHFMGHPNPVPFVGHGIGLEINELPVIAQGYDVPLEENMVLALEPKMVFPEAGVVGVENTFVVTVNGLEKLSGYPDEIRMV